MTKKEMVQEALAKIEQYQQSVSPKERFQRLVDAKLINENGEVLVTTEEKAAGHPIEDAAPNGFKAKVIRP